MNTGEALVSLDARPEQGEGIVTGDVVNTAARIQSSAPVNGIAVGEGTYRATQPVFEWEELEPIDAKGKSAPVPVRRPLRPVARFGSDVIRTHTTPFVGREVERSLLGGLLDRAIRDRTVQLVTVVGEPGVGQVAPGRRAPRRTSTVAPSSSAGGRAAASRTATASRSGRSARS